MTSVENLAEIAVSGPMRRTFTYLVPVGAGALEPGQRVLVPFGRSRKLGFYLGPSQSRPAATLRHIVKPLDTVSNFSPELVRFCLWMADYYFANPADCLMAALPSVMKGNRTSHLVWREPPSWLPEAVARNARPGRKLSAAVTGKLHGSAGILKRLVDDGCVVEEWPVDAASEKHRMRGLKITELQAFQEYFTGKKFQPEYFDGDKPRAEMRAAGWSDHYIRKALAEGIIEPVFDEGPGSILDFVSSRDDVDKIVLTPEQQGVYEKLRDGLVKGFRPTLLHGVTGSGKTVVYCHLCRDVIAQGKTALMLTPEIALTGTTLAYFRGFFGDLVTVIHSAMTERERLDSWQGIRNGRFKIVVGPRSAVFAPLADPGLIIVDEEHDASYKQDDPAPRFHGRDAAIMRAKINNVPVVLGTASPSFESYHHALEGRYDLASLKERPGGATLPAIHVVDMRTDRLKGDLPFFSFTLKKRVEERLENDEQVILFLNRRGHSPQLKCAACGHVPECPNCRVHLTWHKVGRKLSCHYCGYAMQGYDTCPHCGGIDIIYLGAGTQKIEEAIPRLFKGALPVRLDSDSASGRQKAHHILAEFSSAKSNLLLGTQMVTKGLDFPGVTLVGVLSADLSMDLPDFRASERSFASLLQVAGRSGRADKPGEVLVQTYYPESPLIDDVARQDYEGFYEREIQSRKALSFPPFSRLVNFVLSGTDEQLLESTAMQFRDALKDRADKGSPVAELLGPAPCPMYFLRGSYRRHMFVKTTRVVSFVRMLSEWEAAESRFGLPAKIKLIVDVDPDDMM